MISTSHFQRVSDIAYRNWGLHLSEKKQQLVSTRLAKFLRKSKYAGVSEYLDHIESAATPSDLLELFDMLSTNVTSFFRERQHFDYLEREFYTPLAKGNLTTPGRRIRLWSAACSTGPEPYSMAIQALDLLPDIDRWDFKILATDLANSAVQSAKDGVYPADMVENMPAQTLEKHFEKVSVDGQTCYRVSERVRNLVTVGQLNLMADWPVKGPFDVIFCRNVMIYFDQPTKAKLVSRLADLLRPGGIFAVGSAESISSLGTNLRTVQPSMYVR
ncbi:MAG: protein-glutamate O-methyltransferase CheR [Phycisphaerales bacterium]|nr:protein-glutamate O-methyltransferase CheR [Phycisphaerales bacterium]MCB9836272.1 protein-glutamate O-methyltransferase CheR [Phycisphaera sp.]